METPQHGKGPKSEFGSVSFFFQELSEIPQKLKSVEGFLNILGRFPLYLHLIRFPFFWARFLLFWARFLLFWVSFRFSEKVLNSQFVDRFLLFWGRFPFFWVHFRFSEKVVNSQFVDRFPLVLGPFPLFLGPFPIFRKSCKFSVC